MEKPEHRVFCPSNLRYLLSSTNAYKAATVRVPPTAWPCTALPDPVCVPVERPETTLPRGSEGLPAVLGVRPEHRCRVDGSDDRLDSLAREDGAAAGYTARRNARIG